MPLNLQDMIQRIQTVYLFFAALATGLMFIFPLAEYLHNNILFRLNMLGLHNLSSGHSLFSALPVLVLVSISFLLSLTSIFLYKNRMLQVRLGRINIFLLLVLLGAIFYYSDRAVDALGGDDVVIHYQLGAMLPIVSVIMTYLANRAILKDEALVRSADRIR